MSNSQKSTFQALATDAANAYADAVTNNGGKGIAAVHAFDALNRALSDGMKRGEAADALVPYMEAALTARGSKEKCGSNKVTQLALSADAALSHGIRRNQPDVIGAVYLARVGKVDGGADRVNATLDACKGKGAAEIVAALESLPRTASEKKPTPLTLEAVQKHIDAWIAEPWSDADRATLAGMLATAAEAVATGSATVAPDASA